ncbi:MAG: hypothetical protein K0S07_846 [Chlamydiales bacterium]|jgi:hypothetical protein|nr:hypothetical protein [Chlamydiales bacterium]
MSSPINNNINSGSNPPTVPSQAAPKAGPTQPAIGNIVASTLQNPSAAASPSFLQPASQGLASTSYQSKINRYASLEEVDPSNPHTVYKDGDGYIQAQYNPTYQTLESQLEASERETEAEMPTSNISLIAETPQTQRANQKIKHIIDDITHAKANNRQASADWLHKHGKNTIIAGFVFVGVSIVFPFFTPIALVLGLIGLGLEAGRGVQTYRAKHVFPRDWDVKMSDINAALTGDDSEEFAVTLLKKLETFHLNVDPSPEDLLKTCQAALQEFKDFEELGGK